MEGAGPHIQHVDLMVVRSPTQSPHVQYISRIACATSGHKWLMNKRYNQFYSFRKMLLTQLQSKKTRSNRGNAAVERFSLRSYDMDEEGDGYHDASCVKCAAAVEQLKSIAFPKKKLISSLKTIKERIHGLVYFLQTVIDLAIIWPGCSTGKRVMYHIVSNFIGAPIFTAQTIDQPTASLVSLGSAVPIVSVIS